MELLRFFTAGNVDDGKSTLIGRLLYDSKSVSTDIIETLTKQSKSTGENAEIDLALLTDGLRAEREQGITIDVAYKYFASDKRKFIIADTPGHFQYTRNMFTGASNADLAILLVDARHGITEQTRRHSIIASILGVPHIVICVNKMDLINYDQQKFEEIQTEFKAFSEKLNMHGGLKDVTFIPTSAFAGDNVVHPSTNMDWYDGPTLFSFLENVNIDERETSQQTRFQVQYVIRPQTEELHDYRGYAGSILSGSLKKGQQVVIYPDELYTSIAKIEKFGNEIQEAHASEPIIVHLAQDLDVSRGNIIVPLGEESEINNQFEARICWMDNKPYQEGQPLLIQQGSNRSNVLIKAIHSSLNIHTNEEASFDGTIKLNDFCKVQLKTAEMLSFDSYLTNKKTGAFVLINENTNNTVAAGVILG